MFVRQAEPSELSILESFDERNTVSEACIRAGECLVAGIESRPLAFGNLDRSFFKRAFVAMLYAHPEHRRHGLGSALLGHFESIAANKKLWISTNLENMAMRRMLHKHGFELTGVVNKLAPIPELVFRNSLER
ncbi:MAG: GNAT family N-acetyltransferase [Planctomycetota bacterium]|jgi:ribosomal protein S18 acetylase RimI-like enzyme